MRMKKTTRKPAATRSTTGLHATIYRTIRRIPRGRVTTYGAVARIAGYPGYARQVGYALAALPQETAVPWQRVVNASGRISLSDASGAATTQRLRLLAEGVEVDAAGRVSLRRFGWRVRE
jgi:methylated-DNA-protein-cysteine methyltransferase-like protein